MCGVCWCASVFLCVYLGVREGGAGSGEEREEREKREKRDRDREVEDTDRVEQRQISELHLCSQAYICSHLARY
jgi:hypothetical protein